LLSGAWPLIRGAANHEGHEGYEDHEEDLFFLLATPLQQADYEDASIEQRRGSKNPEYMMVFFVIFVSFASSWFAAPQASNQASESRKGGQEQEPTRPTRLFLPRLP
jgi:hypothetical protein